MEYLFCIIEVALLNLAKPIFIFLRMSAEVVVSFVKACVSGIASTVKIAELIEFSVYIPFSIVSASETHLHFAGEELSSFNWKTCTLNLRREVIATLSNAAVLLLATPMSIFTTSTLLLLVFVPLMVLSNLP